MPIRSANLPHLVGNLVRYNRTVAILVTTLRWLAISTNLIIMYSSTKMPASNIKLEELALQQSLELPQLDNMKTQLDLVLLGLEAITRLGSESMLQAAKELGLEAVVADRVSLWRLRQSNPQRKSSGGRKKLDIEEGRALVLIACHLAKQEQAKIREAVGVLEDTWRRDRLPQQEPVLADYTDRFVELYQDRMEDVPTFPPEQLSKAACKLLTDLLFYSGPNGHQYLWSSLLHRSLSN
jgi:Protein of unknown function (DUF3038)